MMSPHAKFRVTAEPKAERTACRDLRPAHTELPTVYKPVRPAERTAAEAVLQAQVEAVQPEAGFPEESRLHQTVTG